MRPIDADRLKEVLERNFGHTGGASVLAQLIDVQPTIDPVKYGKWSKVSESYTWGGTSIKEFKCSLCNKIVNWHKYNYCPNCGARMKGV